VSVKSKRLFKEFIKKNENNYSPATSQFLEKCKSAANEDIENNETQKMLVSEYDLFSNLLRLSLNKKQLELFLGLEEIAYQSIYVTNNIAYTNGFRDGFTLNSKYNASQKAVNL
jgi:hypothetical protein